VSNKKSPGAMNLVPGEVWPPSKPCLTSILWDLEAQQQLQRNLDLSRKDCSVATETIASKAVADHHCPATDGMPDSLSTDRPIQPASERVGLKVESPSIKITHSEARNCSMKLRDDILIGGGLGLLAKHPDYSAAKAGSNQAAVRVVRQTLTSEFVDQIRAKGSNKDIVVQPVLAIEASGFNKIPVMAAARIATELGLRIGTDIVQSSSPQRTGLSGLARIFSRPDFDGHVEEGRAYLLVDDTVTQGGTFAALADYIESMGGRVVGCVALTGKQYSSKISLSEQTLAALREKYGDIEQHFQAAAGRGFDSFTESEARYLFSYKPASTVRDRIIEAGNAGRGNTRDEDIR
jgi:adenine/guanine phosphoribosyltransferase-like PRPP-binding protein